LLKRFIRYYKPHKYLFYLDMFAAVADSLLAVFFPYLTRDLLSKHIPNKNLRIITIIIGIMLCIFLVKAVLNFIRIKWGHVLGTRMEYDMRSDIFRHIQKLSFNYFDNVKTGHIMSRISNDLNMITEVAHHAPEDLLISFFVIILAFIFMFFFNIKLTLIALIPLPMMLLWGWIYGGKMKSIFKNVREKIADINSIVENSVQGIREVKSFTNEDLEILKFKKVNIKLKDTKENVYTMMGLFFTGMYFLRDFYYLIVIAGGIFLIYISQIRITDLIAFILYIGIILPPIDRLINFIEQFQEGVTSFERFIEVMNIEPDIEDRKHAFSLNKINGKIDIENIWFKYNTSNNWILKNINIHIESGENIAIVGESGAGKSTIASLIPRFYEPQKGVIKIDKYDLMDLKQKFLRENIGIVQQNLFLFDSSIRENILYGKPDADEESLITAAKMANIYDFIMGLPDGFDTQIGERGVKLSGGQKQRISIARVFLKDPAILILDEATSSLDSESESLIQDSLKKLCKGRTTIIIAHRLSTVRHVDRIYVFKDGCIIENGTHKKLVAKKGYYYNLYTRNLL